MNHTVGEYLSRESVNNMNLVPNDMIWKSENQPGNYSEGIPTRSRGSGRAGPMEMREEGKVTDTR